MLMMLNCRVSQVQTVLSSVSLDEVDLCILFWKSFETEWIKCLEYEYEYEYESWELPALGRDLLLLSLHYNRWARHWISSGFCQGGEWGQYFHRHPQQKRSIRLVKWYYKQLAGRLSQWFFSNAVLGSNKTRIRCTFKLPRRMPSRGVLISCCLWAENIVCHWPKRFPRNITYSTAAALICVMSNWSIHSHLDVLSWPQWAVL